MSAGTSLAGIPATERVIVGLCHSLNDQLAAVAAYIYLLERRGQLGELGPPLQEHLDQLAHSVRLIRSLSRGAEPEVAPIALSLLAESATELMEAYPEGPVVFRPSTAHQAGVLHADWTWALRSLLVAGAWVSRGCTETVHVEVALEDAQGARDLQVRASGGLPPPPADDLLGDSLSSEIILEALEARAVRIRLPSLR
jgi:hypothetical protein